VRTRGSAAALLRRGDQLGYVAFDQFFAPGGREGRAEYGPDVLDGPRRGQATAAPANCAAAGRAVGEQAGISALGASAP
jgi:hypothetical protein